MRYMKLYFISKHPDVFDKELKAIFEVWKNENGQVLQWRIRYRGERFDDDNLIENFHLHLIDDISEKEIIEFCSAIDLIHHPIGMNLKGL